MSDEFDKDTAARWFAIEYNNASWDLLEKTDRTAEDDIDLIHGAHASALHWRTIGTVVNDGRAQCVVAFAHAALGDGPAALRHANRCVELAEANPDNFEDWDLAFAYDALARATAAAGQGEEAAALSARARELGDMIADPDSKAVFDNWFKPA